MATTNGTWTRADGSTVEVWGDGGDLWPSAEEAKDCGWRGPTMGTYEPTEWDDNGNETAWAVVGGGVVRFEP